MNQATGERYAAVRGRGAERDGRAVRPSGCAELAEAIVGISGFPGRHPGWAQFRALGAASLECCAVAEGVLDAYMVAGRSTLYGWDYLAGLLVCREAGATAVERDGADLVPRNSSPRRPVIAATAPLGRAAGGGGGGMNGALRARKTWRTLEPLHGMVYFVPEAAAAYARLGITGQAGYFASRAAPMGEVGPDVVVSTFYNFNPDVVAAAIPSAWEAAPPSAWLRARLEAADAAFRRILGDAVLGSADMARAASLARLAAEDVVGAFRGPPVGCRPRRAARGPRNPTWRCGTRSPCCASTGATATWRCW